jgi:opacity protein-like surface antigen
LKKILFSLTLIASFFSSALSADNGLYAGAKLGLSSAGDTTMTFSSSSPIALEQSGGAAYGLVVGLKAGNWKFEGEYSKTSVEITGGEYKNNNTSILVSGSEADVAITMLNVIYDIDLKKLNAKLPVSSIYFGLGLGNVSVASMDVILIDGATTLPTTIEGTSGSLQLLAGIDGEITKNIMWDARYQTTSVGSTSGRFDTADEDFITDAYSINIFTVGAKYLF